MKYRNIIGLVQVAALGSLLGAVSCTPETVEKYSDKVPELIENGIITMPEHLTQRTDDFYTHPEKEFDFYRKMYVQLTYDGELNSKEIEGLEFVLRKTLEEMDQKVQDGDQMRNYLNFRQQMKDGHAKLLEYLQRKDTWLELRDEYWNQGAGMAYLSANDIAVNKAQRVFDNNFDSSFVKGKVQNMHKEFPTQEKIPWWLGVLAGAILPGLTSYACRKARKRQMNEISGLYSFVNPFLGFLITDSIHPLAYPARLIALPIAIEAGRYLLNSKKKKATKRWEVKIEPEELKVETEAEPTKMPLTDPWEVDIPEIKEVLR